MIAAIVLAAGESRRMGRPKALLQLGDRTLIEAHVTRLRSVADTVTIVVRAEVAASLPPLDARVVVRATSSQAASLASAFVATIDVEGTERVDGSVWIVTPVDLVPPRHDTLRALIAALGEGVDAVTPEHEGRGGHPVVMRASVLDPYRVGATLPLRERLREVRRAKIPVDDPRVLGDFDVIDDILHRHA